MVLRNFYTILMAKLMSTEAMPFVNYQGSKLTYSGNVSAGNMGFQEQMTLMQTSYNNKGVIFGDGDTPPTVDDYKLSGNVITGLTGSCTQTCEHDDEQRSVTSVWTLTNNNENDVTIRECAILVGFNYQTIIERSVLDTPVTIPAGGIGQVTYTVTFVFPTSTTT